MASTKVCPKSGRAEEKHKAEQTAPDHSTPVSFSQWEEPGRAEQAAALLPSA